MLLRLCILLIVCGMMIGLFSQAEAEGIEEVVYLKNGSVVRGIIVEQIPNETLRIRTQGGSEFVFQMSEVLKITKELPVFEPPSPVRLPPPGSYIQQKDPTMAAILSFLLPGTGQFYVEERNRAYVHWLVYGVSIGFLVKAAEDNYIIFDDSYDPDDDDGYGLIGAYCG